MEKRTLPCFAGDSNPSYMEYGYDAIGRVTKTTVPGGTPGSPGGVSTAEYRKDKTTLTDANNHRRVEQRDGYGRLSAVMEYKGKSSYVLYATTKYQYDVLGNLEKVTPSNVELADGSVKTPPATSMVYDMLSRKVVMSDPDMGTWSYRYHPNGLLWKQTDALGNTITYDYDELNRIRLKTAPESADKCVWIEYFYDDASEPNRLGRLSRLVESDITPNHARREYLLTEFSYDEAGRVVSVKRTFPLSSLSFTTRTRYDGLGRITGITYPNGQAIDYLYNEGGSLQLVRDASTDYAEFSNYTALGQIGRVRYGNGAVTHYGYYPGNKRLESIETDGFQSLLYFYDAAGNVKSITDANNAENSQSFEYDHLNRLRQAEIGPTRVISYDYDELGNMTYNSDAGTYSCNYSNKPHAVRGVTRNGFTATYNYDANGNMIKNRNREILYDLENRPRRINVTDSALPPVSFTYDYQGRRVKKMVGTTSVTTYVSSLYEYKEISGISAPIFTMHIFAGGRRVASKTGTEGWTYLHPDHLGSLKVTTGPAGHIRQTDEYDPFGKTAKETSTGSVIPYKFTGQEEDAETGLYYYGARYYDPALGRFISAGTIVQAVSDPQSLNRYSYARNNPLYYVDPDGHCFWPILGLLALGAGAGASIAAITGGDIGMGALTGAISAAAFMGAHGILVAAKLTEVAIAGAFVHAGMGAASGAVNAAITGGDVGMSALTSGISAGISKYAGGFMPTKDFPSQLAGRMAIGAATGGITSTIAGGNFGQGAFTGAWTAGFAAVFNDALDVEKAKEILSKYAPQFFNKWAKTDFGKMSDPDNQAETDIWSGHITLDKKWEGPLNNDERVSLLGYLAEEYGHSNSGIAWRIWDNATGYQANGFWILSHHYDLFMEAQAIEMKFGWMMKRD